MNSLNLGPKPLFSEPEVYRTLELIGEHGPIGRKRLAEKLGVGEGSTRTILGRLKDKDLISSTPRGHVLTREGRRELRGEPRKFLELDVGDLTVGRVSITTKVEDAAVRVRRGVEQRDEAIKAGAEGATVLVFEDGNLRLPGSDAEVEDAVRSELLELFRPEDGDVIVIGTASDREDAERGALASAESLSKS